MGVKNAMLYFLICVIWGSTWLVIRIGDSAGLPPFFGAASRFVLSAAVLWIIVAVARVPLPKAKREIRAVIVNGLLSCATSYGIVYWCAQFIPSGLESVIFGTMPLWTILFGSLVLKKEKLNANRIVGVLLGLLGIALIFYPEMRDVTNSEGSVIAILLIAPIVSAVSLLVTKSEGKSIHPIALNAIAVTIGAVIFSVIAGFTTDFRTIHLEWTEIWTVGYLAIFGTVIAFVVYYRLLQTIPAVTVAYVALITPVIAVLLGWVVLNERLDSYSVIGSALVLLGVWRTTRPARRNETEDVSEFRKPPEALLVDKPAGKIGV